MLRHQLNLSLQYIFRLVLNGSYYYISLSFCLINIFLKQAEETSDVCCDGIFLFTETPLPTYIQLCQTTVKDKDFLANAAAAE